VKTEKLGGVAGGEGEPPEVIEAGGGVISFYRYRGGRGAIRGTLLQATLALSLVVSSSKSVSGML